MQSCLLGNLEDIKHELLHFDAIRFVGLDGLAEVVAVRDLLLRHMVKKISLSLAENDSATAMSKFYVKQRCECSVLEATEKRVRGKFRES